MSTSSRVVRSRYEPDGGKHDALGEGGVTTEGAPRVLWSCEGEALGEVQDASSMELLDAMERCRGTFTIAPEDVASLKSSLLTPFEDGEGLLRMDRVTTLIKVTGHSLRDVEVAVADLRRFAEILPAYVAWLSQCQGPDEVNLGGTLHGFISRPRVLRAAFSSDFDLRLGPKLVVDMLAAGGGLIKADSRQPLIHLWLNEELRRRGIDSHYAVLCWEHRHRPELTEQLARRADRIVLFGTDQTIQEARSKWLQKRIVGFGAGRSQAIVGHVGPSRYQIVARELVARSALNCGSECRNPKKIYVVGDVYDAVRDGITEAARAVSYGRPWDAEGRPTDVEIGFVGRESIRTVDSFLSRHGIAPLGTHADSDYAPLAVREVPDGLEIPAEDLPAPLVLLQRAQSLEDAIASANRACRHAPYGMSQTTYAFVEDDELAIVAARTKTHLVDGLLQRAGGLISQGGSDMNLAISHHGRRSLLDETLSLEPMVRVR